MVDIWCHLICKLTSRCHKPINNLLRGCNDKNLDAPLHKVNLINPIIIMDQVALLILDLQMKMLKIKKTVIWMSLLDTQNTVKINNRNQAVMMNMKSIKIIQKHLNPCLIKVRFNQYKRREPNQSQVHHKTIRKEQFTTMMRVIKI